MTSRDFAYWLQGYFEIGASQAPDTIEGLRHDQIQIIKRHLALVFVHEIDPAAGPPEHQTKLDKVHLGDVGPDGKVYRC